MLRNPPFPPKKVKKKLFYILWWKHLEQKWPISYEVVADNRIKLILLIIIFFLNVILANVTYVLLPIRARYVYTSNLELWLENIIKFTYT